LPEYIATSLYNDISLQVF